MKLISDEYRALNRSLHERQNSEGQGYGTRGSKFAEYVYRLILKNDFRTTVDYGCGKGTLKSTLKELGLKRRVHEYDPAIPGKLKCPDEADLVVCTDVLEHVEPEFLDNVLAHIAGIAQKAAFITVHTQPALKTLDDGRNAHLILQPHDWWLAKFSAYFSVMQHSTDILKDGRPYRTRALLLPIRSER